MKQMGFGCRHSVADPTQTSCNIPDAEVPSHVPGDPKCPQVSEVLGQSSSSKRGGEAKNEPHLLLRSAVGCRWTRRNKDKVGKKNLRSLLGCPAPEHGPVCKESVTLVSSSPSSPFLREQGSAYLPELLLPSLLKRGKKVPTVSHGGLEALKPGENGFYFQD